MEESESTHNIKNRLHFVQLVYNILTLRMTMRDEAAHQDLYMCVGSKWVCLQIAPTYIFCPTCPVGRLRNCHSLLGRYRRPQSIPVEERKCNMNMIEDEIHFL